MISDKFLEEQLVTLKYWKDQYCRYGGPHWGHVVVPISGLITSVEDALAQRIKARETVTISRAEYEDLKNKAHPTV